MLCGVLILRGIAVANVPAGQTEAQVYPLVPYLYKDRKFNAILQRTMFRFDLPGSD
jgi:hypothetical protein